MQRKSALRSLEATNWSLDRAIYSVRCLHSARGRFWSTERFLCPINCGVVFLETYFVFGLLQNRPHLNAFIGLFGRHFPLNKLWLSAAFQSCSDVCQSHFLAFYRSAFSWFHSISSLYSLDYWGGVIDQSFVISKRTLSRAAYSLSFPEFKRSNHFFAPNPATFM